MCAALLVEVKAPQIYRALLGIDGEDGFYRCRFRTLNIHKSLTDMLEAANKKQIVHARREQIVFYPDGSIEIRGTLK